LKLLSLLNRRLLEKHRLDLTEALIKIIYSSNHGAMLASTQRISRLEIAFKVLKRFKLTVT
jgi:hypothetical protein